MTVVVKVHHQAAQVGELVVGVDHQRVLAVFVLDHQRVGVGKVGLVAGKGHGRVVGIAQPGVGAGGQDDVHALQLGGQQPLVGQQLQVGHQNDFVDALGNEVVDHGLQLRGQQGHVVAAHAVVVFDLGARGRGNRLEQLGGGAHQANLGPTFDQNSRGHDLALEAGGLLQTGGSGGVHINGLEVVVAREIQVGADVRKLRALGATGAFDGVAQHARAQVELMVANGRGFHAHGVVDGDIDGGNRHRGGGSQGATGGAVERSNDAGVCARCQKGAGDEVVATGQRDAVRVCVFKLVNQCGQLGRGGRSQQARLGVGKMQQLQGECFLSERCFLVASQGIYRGGGCHFAGQRAQVFQRRDAGRFHGGTVESHATYCGCRLRSQGVDHCAGGGGNLAGRQLAGGGTGQGAGQLGKDAAGDFVVLVNACASRLLHFHGQAADHGGDHHAGFLQIECASCPGSGTSHGVKLGEVHLAFEGRQTHGIEHPVLGRCGAQVAACHQLVDQCGQRRHGGGTCGGFEHAGEVESG